MLGKEPQLNPLESRKQLLIAESEINRAQLSEEFRAMTDSVCNFTDRVKSVGFFASATAAVMAGISAFGSQNSAATEPKRSWLQTSLKVAKVAGSVWLAFRARQR
jgi:negative regulator of sigma E activity